MMYKNGVGKILIPKGTKLKLLKNGNYVIVDLPPSTTTDPNHDPQDET